LKNDPSPLVQQDVITALNKLEYKKAAPVLIDKLRSSSHPDVRAASVTALEQIGTTEAITALKEARDDESVKVRFAAKNALKNLRDTPAFAQLTPEQQSETAEERTTWWMVR
jgi:HEAT repeat protein